MLFKRSVEGAVTGKAAARRTKRKGKSRKRQESFDAKILRH